MSLFDRIVPSERAVDLALAVKRVRRNTGLDVVPMLVVEGRADESLWSGLCVHGRRQVFAAGTRTLVEQLLRLLRNEPIEGCECVFLTDCDGKGKVVDLKEERALLVTHCCDIEADLVRLGLLDRVLEPVVGEEDARRFVEESIALGSHLSMIRRAAARASIKMKHRGQRLRVGDLPWHRVRAWLDEPPRHADVIALLQPELDWSAQDVRRVETEAEMVPEEFERSCSGKDVIDACYCLLVDEAVRRFPNADALHREVGRMVDGVELDDWEVMRRLRAWEQDTECEILTTVAQ